MLVFAVSGVVNGVVYKTKFSNIYQNDYNTKVKRNSSNRLNCWNLVVEVTGFEPATFWSRTKRKPCNIRIKMLIAVNVL